MIFEAGPVISIVATVHSTELSSPTFERIREVLSPERCDLLIVEGIPYSMGLNPDWIKPVVNPPSSGRFEGGEVLFAAGLARARKIDVRGGEPDDDEVIRELEEKWPKDKVFDAYIVRGLASRAGRNGDKRPDAMTALLADVEHKYARFFPGVDEASFPKWYQSQFTADYTADPNLWRRGDPCIGDEAAEIIHRATELRNNYLGNLIASVARQHAHIAVIYGAGHMAPLVQILQKSFGAPTFQTARA